MAQKNQNPSSKIRWSVEEEKYMAQAYQKQGIKSWKIISKFINQNFYGLIRTPKQCRERYNNYVKIRTSMSQWTPEQTDILFQKYSQLGSKWIQICKYLTGRSENNIKNRFYCTLRRLIRKINTIQKQQKMKNQKLIKECLIIKLLENTEKLLFKVSNDESYQQLLRLQESIKKNILNLLKTQKKAYQNQLIVQLIAQICQLKSFKRTHTSKNKTKFNQQQIGKIQQSNQEIQIFKGLIFEQKVQDLSLKQINCQLGSENTRYDCWIDQSEIKKVQLRLIQIDQNIQEIRMGKEDLSIFNYQQEKDKFFFFNGL